MADMDYQQEMSRLSRQAGRTAERARERFERVGPLEGVAKSPDGAISVTVSPGGSLSDISIAPYALRSGPDAVAQQIMELAGKATRRAGDKMYRTLAPVLGPDGEEQLSSLGYEQLPEDELYDEPYAR